MYSVSCFKGKTFAVCFAVAFLLAAFLFASNEPASFAMPSTTDSIALSRPAYRQGDTVVFNYWVTDVPGATDHVAVVVSIVDPNGIVMAQYSGFAIPINSTHYIYSGEYLLPSDAELGTWTVNGSSTSYDKRGNVKDTGSAEASFQVQAIPPNTPVIIPVDGELAFPQTIYMRPDGSIDPFTIAFFVVNSTNNASLSGVLYEVYVTDPLGRVVSYYSGQSGSNGEVRIEGDTSVLASLGAYIVTARLRNSTMSIVDTYTDLLNLCPIVYPYASYVAASYGNRTRVSSLESGKGYYIHLNVTYMDPDRGRLVVPLELRFGIKAGNALVEERLNVSVVVDSEETEMWIFFRMPYGRYPDTTYRVYLILACCYVVDLGSYSIDWNAPPEEEAVTVVVAQSRETTEYQIVPLSLPLVFVLFLIFIGIIAVAALVAFR